MNGIGQSVLLQLTQVDMLGPTMKQMTITVCIDLKQTSQLGSNEDE